MKKTATILILAFAVWACHRKTVPSGDITISNKTKTEDVKIKEEKTVTPPPAPTGTNTDLAVAGKNIYTTRCNRCHGLKETANYTQEQWENILKSMIPKAKLTEDESKQVTAYVMANAKK